MKQTQYLLFTLSLLLIQFAFSSFFLSRDYENIYPAEKAYHKNFKGSPIYFGPGFRSVWDTSQSGTSNNDQITIPTNPLYTYNYTVDWGDGQTDSNITSSVTHTYTSPGIYVVEITGTFPTIYFNDSGDRLKIIEILQWGNIEWQTMEDAFHGCENLNFDAIDSPDLSRVTTLQNMFKDCSSFNGIVNNWDVSTIINMSGLFEGAIVFNRPLDNWNTISVTDLSRTFRGARLFNEPLDNWNTASLTSLEFTFAGASRFNQNINNWDVSQVTTMQGTFSDADDFNQPLNLWNVSNVTNMSSMFDDARDFDQPINNWNVSNVTDMSRMFYGFIGRSFNQPLNLWNVGNVTNMSQMFRSCNIFNQPLNDWDVSNVTDMSGMFERANLFDQPLDNWNVSNVTDMSDMFSGTQAFNQQIGNWNVSSVTDMSGMFRSSNFNQPIGNWNVGNVTNMSTMFSGVRADLLNPFDQPLENWDVRNVTDMSGMFAFSEFNQNINSWATTSLINLNSTFNNAINFNQPLDNWNISLVTNMIGSFSNASSFDQNLGNWNITNTINMTNMLSNSGISQENYDNILIGWAAQTVRDNVSLGANNLEYCDGRDARQDLIDNHNWVITGDAVNCTFVLCTQITSPRDGDTNVPANSDIRWAPAPNATGYRVSIRRENGVTTQIIYDNQDFGNVVGLDFTNEFTPGDTVYVTVVPYNADGPATGCSEISFTVIESWVNSPEAFKLTYDTRLQEPNQTTPVNQLKIETTSGLTYNYSIDWGDGQYDNNVTGQITHTYLVPGVYTVSIIGTFPAPRHNEFNSDSFKLLSIDQWGTQVWQSMQNAFSGCENMEYNAGDIPNLSNVTNMGSMFIVCRKFNGNINNWDVSNVTNMSAMFGVTDVYNQPLDNWDVSNVSNMALMFFRTNLFNQNINNWNTGNVTTMARMFEDAVAFNQPINDWNVDNVTDMEKMFYDTGAFNQPLDNWNVANVTTMEEMFRRAQAFDQNIDSWNVGSVNNMASMFEQASVFDQPLNSWNVSNVTTMNSMFERAAAFNQPLNNWNVSNVTIMSGMFSSATVFNQNINSWNVTNVTTMRSMFNNADAFDQPLDMWNVDSVVDMSSMFQGTDIFNQPINTWNVSAVANMSNMFNGAISFDQPLDNWDVSSVTLMPSMFDGTSVFNQNINSWDVSVVTNMQSMFKNAAAFNQPLDNWSTGELQNTQEMFSGAALFDQNIDTWNVSFVTTMEEMFRDAISYNQNMNSWNVASVTTMEGMFRGATSFNGIIESWNVRSVSTMENMFDGAISFNQTLNDWRINNTQNLNFMFRNATSYNQNMDQWNPGTVSMQSMFQNASAFDQFLGDWNVSNVNNMLDMLDNSALSRENYDNSLISWSDQALTPGINLGAENLLYCESIEERQSMIDTYGWIFTGDILDCPIPECTILISPLDGDTDVPLNTNLTWEPVLYATFYNLTITLQPSGTVINETVSTESYEFAMGALTGSSNVTVLIEPINDTGAATGCITESFSLSSDPPTAPDCTVLTSPLNNETEVTINTDFSWAAISNADGYLLTVGTASGIGDIVNNLDVGNVTTYDLTNDLPENTAIFVTIIPYNEEGSASGCTEESFTTELIPVVPNCTSLSNPLNGATNVPVDTNLNWNIVDAADGYLLSVGTTQGGIEITNNIDVGNFTIYDFPEDLTPNRTFYVTIIPYNEVGDAIACTEESFRTGSNTSNDPPVCTSLTTPVNGATDVAINTNLSWTVIGNAEGYRLTVGTTSGGNDILDSFDVGNISSYDLPNDLPESTQIYVTITPYNSIGGATGCTEESFTTETLDTTPSCTSLTTPVNGARDVAINTNLSWTAIGNVEGYRLTVGTTSGGNDILDSLDVGNTSSYDLPNDLPESTQIYVTITPYNSIGDATGCTEESFTTETPGTAPNCTSLTTPANGATDVAINTDLSWTVIGNAEGYRLTVGTTSGGNDILDSFNVGNVSDYDLPSDLPENIQIFVTIIPYNSIGNAIGCTEESFTTETLGTVPNCTSLTTPVNGATDVAINTDLSWTVIGNAEGYRITVGTTSGGNDILDSFDVGNVSDYDLPSDLPENMQIFVTIIPYNSIGNATSCSEESFITENNIVVEEDNTRYGFSPDGDGINEFWFIDGIDQYPDNKVYIYNRWGDLVFEISGYDNISRVFKGIANRSTALGAGDLPEGTYFFHIQVAPNSSIKKIKGFLVLKR